MRKTDKKKYKSYQELKKKLGEVKRELELPPLPPPGLTQVDPGDSGGVVLSVLPDVSFGAGNAALASGSQRPIQALGNPAFAPTGGWPSLLNARSMAAPTAEASLGRAESEAGGGDGGAQ